MFKVVVVDDEALVRIGIKSMIDWEAQGCELVGEASNGQAGYELIVNLRPDIVITDLKMPVVDGLEMIKQLLEQGIKPRFIVLSGYNDFELVRKVMKYGIHDYLMKLELEPELLISVLQGIQEELVKENRQLSENSRRDSYLKSSQYNLRKEFFKKVIARMIKEEDVLRDEMEYLQIALTEEHILSVGIQILNISDFNNYEEEDINLLEFSILGVVEEILKDFFMGYCFKWSNDQYLIIASIKELPIEPVLRQMLEDMGNRIATMLRQYFNAKVAIAVSDVAKGLLGISSVSFQSLKALTESFYHGTERVIFFQDVYQKQQPTAVMSLENLDVLIEHIDNSDLHGIEGFFEDVICSMASGKLPREKIYDTCARIAYLVSLSVKDDEKAMSMIFGDTKGIFDKLVRLGSIAEITEWMRKLEKGLYFYLLNKESIHNNKLIREARKYIKDNVGKTINLNEISSALNISAGYFCTIFKQITGVKFTDYVTEVKMEHAKKLLKESNLKIYEVAQRTGYENAYYFSKVFKKVTGLTPKEYINKSAK